MKSPPKNENATRQGGALKTNYDKANVSDAGLKVNGMLAPDSLSRRIKLARQACAMVTRYILDPRTQPGVAFDDVALGFLIRLQARRRAECKLFGGAQ
jgi:hypothetical protein